MTCDYEEHYYRRDAYGGEVGYPDYFGAESVERRANADVFAELILSVAPAVATSLDVGCGGGYLVNALSGLGIAAIGTDSSEFAIGHARRSGVGRFEQLSVHEVPAAALGQFDVVTMMDVIEHLKDPLGAVGTASRMVRPGGLLMILTPRYGGSLLVKQGADYVHSIMITCTTSPRIRCEQSLIDRHSAPRCASAVSLTGLPHGQSKPARRFCGSIATSATR